MSFLKAGWRKLIMANYTVPEEWLLPYLPANTELDTWNGQHYVSVVGFLFVDTRMLGFKIPFHVNFEEVNLRFYVKYNDNGNWKRGVVFIQEIVPRFALAWVANTLYKEHYVVRKMEHEWIENENSRAVEYRWLHQGNWQSISVNAALKGQDIEAGSETAFITEHYWGYTQVNKQKTYEYEVTHPIWQCYPVHEYEIKVDFGAAYGAAFAELSQREPQSVLLAEGSEITVENKRTLRLI